MKRHSKIPPRPKWQPNPGYVLFYNREVPIKDAEVHAKFVIGRHDDLPREARDRANEGGPAPKKRTTWRPPS